MTVKHGIRDVEYTKIIQLLIFCQADPEISGNNARVMLVDECFWAILSLTAGKQKCCWIRMSFYKTTLSLFCFSSYGVMLNTGSLLMMTFSRKNRCQMKLLPMQFAYIVPYLFHGYLIPVSYESSWAFWVSIILLIHCIQRIENL